MSVKSTIKNGLRAIISMLKEEKKIPIPVAVGEDNKLQGKIALITGGSSGIGAAMAKEFIRCGGKVIIAGTNEERLRNVVQEIGGNVRYIVLNVLEVQKMPDKIKEASELFPEKRIDILVNSAGVVVQNDFMDMTEQEYDRIMDINAKGSFFMSQAIGRFMIENNIRGHILNVTSSSALRPAWTPYQMSKWAMRGFTMGLADKLLPYGIVVNAIAPGPTATPMLGKKKGDSIDSNNPSGRYAMPSEIAALAAFMVSDMGNMIVGDTFYMTGGSGIITYHY